MAKFLPLRSQCPVAACNDRTIYNWVHAGCGSSTEISNKGTLRCSNSSHYYTESCIFDWLFQCGTYDNRYMACDQSKLIVSLALLAEYQSAENKDWLEMLMDRLYEERNQRKGRA